MRLRATSLIVLGALLAACGGVREQIRAQPGPAPTRFDARELVDVLPPGRIQAIDRTSFESSETALLWLKPAEPVIVVAIGLDARAYPLAIMVWHEIVNDTF